MPSQNPRSRLSELEPCFTAHRFRPLLGELVSLLRMLDEHDWQRQTLAPRWTVRDVAAHLLDGDLRKIAVYRDAHFLPLEQPIAGDADLTKFINALNASGVSYAARLSPRLIVDLLEISGSWVADLIEGLPPRGRSIFPVSWAGETQSENWMDTGREYTERWHHQMQIRDAVQRPLLLDPNWMEPLLDISVRALPYGYRSVHAPPATTVVLEVFGETSGEWTLYRSADVWTILSGSPATPTAKVRLSTDDSWRLLYNAPFDRAGLEIEGEADLAAPLLKVRSVIV